MPECMTADEIGLVTLVDVYIGLLSNYMMCGWPSRKLKSEKKHSHSGHSEIQFKMNCNERKNHCMNFPAEKGTVRTNFNHMSIEKIRLLVNSYIGST